MTDKERILLCLTNRLLRHSLYNPEGVAKWRTMQPGITGGGNPLQPGDLVTASSTNTPNEFIVGFVERIQPECVVIREIGGKRLCSYYNEIFNRIDKDLLGYEILEGTEYVTYQKVLKAFEKSEDSYKIRFQSISFNGKVCTVTARKSFSDETVYAVSFEHNSKTSIKSIVELLDNQADKTDAHDSNNPNTNSSICGATGLPCSQCQPGPCGSHRTKEDK